MPWENLVFEARSVMTLAASEAWKTLQKRPNLLRFPYRKKMKQQSSGRQAIDDTRESSAGSKLPVIDWSASASDRRFDANHVLAKRPLTAYNLFANLVRRSKDATYCRRRTSHLFLDPYTRSLFRNLKRQLVCGLLRPVGLRPVHHLR